MRFHPHTEEERQNILKAIGVSDINALYADVPKEATLNVEMDLPKTASEIEVEAHLEAYASQNQAAVDGPFFLGAGCYYHHIPASADHIIQRSEFLTAYTPYQPEIAQGTLAYIFEFQSMVASILGQDVANASMYDGATSVTEAALMARRITKRPNVVIHGELHPDYLETLQTYWEQVGGEVILDGEPDENTACLLVQSPDFHGNPHKLDPLRAACDASGALLVVAFTEVVAFGMLPAPSQADIVAGEGQSLGVPMGFGGPHLGLFACKQKYIRQMPGRLCGETTDADGKRGFVLTLNTREQHIRREKATSNICSNQGLCALAFTVHLSLLGEQGFTQLARLNHAKACQLASKLEALPQVELENENFFNEFVVKLPTNSRELRRNLAAKGILAGLPLDPDRLLLTATEMTSEKDMDALVTALKEELA